VVPEVEVRVGKHETHSSRYSHFATILDQRLLGSLNAEPRMVDAKVLCAACHGSNPRFRCTSCRSAWYCCRSCQQRDWKRHRRLCRATTELAAILQRVSPGQAEQEYYTAKDKIESLLLENEVHQQALARKASLGSKSARGAGQRQDGGQGHDSQHHPPPRDVSLSSSATISFRIQHMPNLSCYQVQVGDGKASSDVAWELDELESRLEPSVDSESTHWILRRRGRSILLSLHLPGRIADVTVYEAAPVLCFKLSYEPQSASVPFNETKSNLSVSEVPTIKCRSCRAPLADHSLSGDSVAVTQVLPLHSGQFHEMMDYLICYPGQPAVDVGSNSLFAAAASHVALEDETSIVLQGQDLNCAWTVLAIAGYGEDPNDGSTPSDPRLDLLDNSAARRGSRPWRDWVGGATLTCATCASVLGYATMGEESVTPAARLLKHRIDWASSDSDQRRGYGITDFVMSEMIRYAETKAIFCFQVTCEGATDCVLIRLINWESEVATHNQGSTSEIKSLDLEWHRLVQVLYEESTISAVAADVGSDALNWMWTNDWCCPPVKNMVHVAGSPAEPPASLVRLFVCLDEYETLRHELLSASGWFSEASKQATILSTTGKSSANVGVAAVLL
jgi:HECT-like Ubiquitin-conjugating enzyme (E2)-binding/MYND finger